MSDRDSSASSDSEKENEQEKHTPASDLVVTKYNMAAAVVNGVLQNLIKKCIPGQSITELCELGDKEILEKTSQLFKKEKEIKKGVAFPTCISVNNCVCHFSPLKSEKEVCLAAEDVVKLDLGAHVDGYIAVAAHTLVVKEPGNINTTKITGKKADVILAAYYALEAAIRMLKPGQHKNVEITDVIQKVAESFKCKPVENMLSHQLKRNKIDGEKQVIQNPGEKQRQELEKCDFEQYDVFALDILISTGDGKTKELDTRTTVYMKNEDVIYQLKLKGSRAFFSDADKRFGSLPFTLRAFDDEVKTKMGIGECERHNLMKPFPVLYEKDGEYVAQMKATILLMPNGLLRVTGLPNFDPKSLYESEYKIEDAKIQQLIQSSLKPNKKKKKPATTTATGVEPESVVVPAADDVSTKAEKKKVVEKKGADAKKSDSDKSLEPAGAKKEDVKKLAPKIKPAK